MKQARLVPEAGGCNRSQFIVFQKAEEMIRTSNNLY